MLKVLFVGSAIAFALPALAQTAAPQVPVATATNDHDPTMEDDESAPSGAGTTPVTQVNGGVTSGSATAGIPASAEAIVDNHSTAGWTGMGGPYEPVADYPPCTRTRTDRCIQLNERRRSPE